MGGTIAVTLRTATGIVEPMARWSNPLPLFSHNIHFIKGDQAHIDDYMEQWYAMKQDWDQHRQTRRWDFPMTPTYAPWRLKAPMGAGLVVFDFSRQIILSMQNQTNFGFVYPDSITQDSEPDYNELIAQGRLYLIKHFYDKGVEQVSKIDTLEEVRFLDKVLQAKRNAPDYQYIANIAVDLQPWKVSSFPETENGALSLKLQMQELGFEFSKEEDDQWNEWIAERKVLDSEAATVHRHS